MRKSLYLSLLILVTFSVAVFAVENIKPVKRLAPTRKAPVKIAPTATDQKTIKPIVPVKQVAPIQMKKITPPDPSKFQILRSGTVNPAPKPFRMTACTLPDGNVFFGWEGFAQQADKSYAGRAAIGGKYNPTNFTRIGVEMIYSYTRDSYFLSSNSAMAFGNGNVLAAFNDRQGELKSTGKGTLVILKPDMRIKAGPIIFCQTKVRDIALAALPGGNAILIAYCDEEATTGKGKFVIVDSNGQIIVQPTAFTYKHDLSMFSAGTTAEGVVMIAFYGHEEDGPLTGSKNILIDSYGNTVRPLKSFWNCEKIPNFQICPLTNGTVLVAGNWQGKATCLVVDDNNTRQKVHGLKQFYNGKVTNIRLTRLDNDQVFISFHPAEQDKVMCAMVDATGAVLKDPMLLPMCSEYKIQNNLETIAQTRLNDNSVLVFAHGYKAVGNDATVSAWYVMR